MRAGRRDILEVLDEEDPGSESQVSNIAKSQDDDATRHMVVEETSRRHDQGRRWRRREEANIPISFGGELPAHSWGENRN